MSPSPSRARALALGAACLVASSCAFTNEPDPGGFGDAADQGLPGPPPAADAGMVENGDPDAEQARDMYPGAPDAAPPPADAYADDDGGPDEPVDAAQFDASADLGPDASADFGPDAAPPSPEDDCDAACSALTACGPGPDPAECRRECLAEDGDVPGTAARLAACVETHIAGGRCDVAALQSCMSADPPQIDPRCVLACDVIGACAAPDRPDCVETCAAAAGPERTRLARCAGAHLADGACDVDAWGACDDLPPTAEDECRFLCDAGVACGLSDEPVDACVDPCLDADDGPRRAAVECAATHLDRGECDSEAFGACAE